MPNWCSNSGTIKGSPQVIEKLWEILKDDPFGLTTLFPCPEELTGTMSGFMSDNNPKKKDWEAQQQANKEKYGYTDWYFWCIDNWGTKWAPEFDFELTDPQNISFRGDSAWAPPSRLFLNITRLIPVIIDTTYVEEGMAFVGATIYANGKMYDDYREISYSAEEDENGDIDWDDYNDHMDKVRSECESLAWLAYSSEVPSVPTTMLDYEDLFRQVISQRLGENDDQ